MGKVKNLIFLMGILGLAAWLLSGGNLDWLRFRLNPLETLKDIISKILEVLG